MPRPHKYPRSLMAEALELCRQGASPKTVSSSFGLCPSTLDAWRRKAGLIGKTRGSPRKYNYDKVRRLRDEGVSVSEISRVMGMDRKGVYYALSVMEAA